ncbi:MAG: histidine--tRNA ligase [Candidatus Melainabacteria bacterium]|nr:histidine--tRNA ligase [Candidatus Melainabacteria bacterium]
MSTFTPLRAKPPRGMRDLLPEETALRDWATGVILETYKTFGFTRIETPAVESIELLKRGDGGENLALIYEILKRGEKLEKALADTANSGTPEFKDSLSDLGLRFDLTVPLARFYANNNAAIPNPFKSIQVGSVWRAESPQAGRFRQFTQCDIDIMGVKGVFAELDLLEATASALLNLGFEKFVIRINDRRILSELALHCNFDSTRLDSVFIAVDKLDKIGLDGIASELRSNGHPDAAVDKLLEIFKPIQPVLADTTLSGIAQFKKIAEMLPTFSSPDAVDELNQLIEAIDGASAGKYNIAFDPTLVRGMGYYTGPIFEVSVPGLSYSVAGGGRYDKMIEKFIGREVPACGFSIGFERIISVLEEKKFKPPVKFQKLAFIYDPQRDKLKDVFKASKKLRTESVAVSLTPKKKDMKKQIDQLGEQGYSSFVVFKGDPDNVEVKSIST